MNEERKNADENTSGSDVAKEEIAINDSTQLDFRIADKKRLGFGFWLAVFWLKPFYVFDTSVQRYKNYIAYEQKQNPLTIKQESLFSSIRFCNNILNRILIYT